jgi:hypothetical protein
MGAGIGQKGFVGLVDPIRRRGRAMAVLAVPVAGLAAGAFGVGVGRPLAEGGGLAFGSAAGLVKFGAEARDLGGQRLDLMLLLLNEFQQFLIAGRTSGHRG